MEIMIISALSMVLIFFAFIIGLHYGSKVKKNEVIEIPNPIKAVNNVVETKKQIDKISKEQQIEDINLANIENYDGTGLGQQDFPK